MMARAGPAHGVEVQLGDGQKAGGHAGVRLGAAGQHQLEHGLGQVGPSGHRLGDQAAPGAGVEGQTESARRLLEALQMVVQVLDHCVRSPAQHPHGIEAAVTPDQADVVRGRRGSPRPPRWSSR